MLTGAGAGLRLVLRPSGCHAQRLLHGPIAIRSPGHQQQHPSAAAVAKSTVCSPSTGATLVPNRCAFYEASRRGDLKYDIARRQMNEITLAEAVYWGSKVFVQESIRWLEEWRETIRGDRPVYMDREENVMWKFDSQETIDQWIVSKDRDWGEGFSTATFERSPAGHGLFHGFLDTKTFPRDPTITRVGWTFVSCPPAAAPFKREGSYDWEGFTHMVLRVRGDGRTYALSMRTPGVFALTLFDVYTFGIYTHGGPYWQYVKIPFSRFVFTVKGSVQDFQEPLDQGNIQSFGIGCMDRVNGPFRLEIDYIALVRDDTWTEECQYEMYHIPQSRFNDP